MFYLELKNSRYFIISGPSTTPAGCYKHPGSAELFLDYADMKELDAQLPDLLLTAIQDAFEWHAGQTYSNGMEYVLHCHEVAHLLQTCGENDLETLIGAWHHDALEDTQILATAYKAKYGHNVWSIVDACTGEGANRKEKQQSISNKLQGKPKAILIKIADRCVNMKNSLGHPKKLKMYCSEINSWETILQQCENPKLLAIWNAIVAQMEPEIKNIAPA